MKQITQIVIAILMVLNVFSAQAQEVVTEKIAENKKWIANKVSGHSAWSTEACVASTKGDFSLLEVYAEKVGELFTEPTVQILFSVPKQVYSAEVTIDNGAKWIFTLANAPAEPEMQAVLARLKDREAIVTALRKANTVNVKLRDVKGKTIKPLVFSLSGSSKTIDAQVKACSLNFETI